VVNWEIDYSPLPVYIRVATAGTVSFEDHKALWDKLLASEHWSPGIGVLMDSAAIPPTGVKGYRITQAAAKYFVERDADIA
jgi:hypothetical protein